MAGAFTEGQLCRCVSPPEGYMKFIDNEKTRAISRESDEAGYKYSAETINNLDHRDPDIYHRTLIDHGDKFSYIVAGIVRGVVEDKRSRDDYIQHIFDTLLEVTIKRMESSPVMRVHPV